MQPFSIFRSGRHTAANGEAHDFSDDRLQEAIDHYDPAVSEAPIVVGHPKDNAPAFGWIKGLQRNDDGEMIAVPDQVEPQFQEMVESGRFKKRSASFYKPDAPNNPKPGVWYLRHVGFLGAQPPSVKGLSDKGIAFAENEEGVVELADMSALGSVLAGTLKRLREYFIDQHDTETADRVIPSFVPEDIEAMSQPSPNDEPEPAPDNFSEPGAGGSAAGNTEPDDTQPDEVIEMSDTDKQELERLRAVERRRQASEAIQPHVDAGRLPPAMAATAAEFAASLDADNAVEFGEGEGKVERTPRDRFLDLLGQLPQQVDYSERTADDSEGAADYTDPALSTRARSYQREHGVSFTVAMDAVAAGKDQASV